MAVFVVVSLTMVSLLAVNSIDVLTLMTAQQIGKFVYKAVRDHFGDSKTFIIHGITCDWERKAGFHQWQWKYDGEMTCPELDETFKRTGCKSRRCAFKDPMKHLLKHLKDDGRINQDEFDEGMRKLE